MNFWKNEIHFTLDRFESMTWPSSGILRLIYKTDDQNDTVDVQSEIHWLFDETKRD